MEEIGLVQVVLMTGSEAWEWKSRVGSTAGLLRSLLFEGYERRVWESLGYDTWSDCLKALAEEYGFTERRLWQLHAANQTEKLLNHGSVSEIPERVIRPLTSLPPETQRTVYEHAISTAPNGRLTAAHMERVTQEYKADCEPEVHRPLPLTAANHAVSANPDYDGDEWYTPRELIDRVRQVLGEIDLDPASNDSAQDVVAALNYYTKDDNALSREWFGRVFMNPPYSTPLIQQFVAKVAAEYDAGRVTEAIILTNNSSETRWFQSLLSRSATCFLSGRVQFWRPNADVFGARQGQAVFYLGADTERFIEAFRLEGIVVKPL